jgi:hypothetical protein
MARSIWSGTISFGQIDIPDVCIPPAPPDVDRGDIPDRCFTVLTPDPHRIDGSDADGLGCDND